MTPTLFKHNPLFGLYVVVMIPFVYYRMWDRPEEFDGKTFLEAARKVPANIRDHAATYRREQEWTPVPWWHPMRWFGMTVRTELRDIDFPTTVWWYDRPLPVARAQLERSYGGECDA